METECRPAVTLARHYQQFAKEIIYKVSGEVVPGLLWVIWTCETKYCLHPDHLEACEPRSYQYPPYTCIYCGLIAEAQDHLLPKSYSGVAGRKYVPTVPSCHECNSLLSDAFTQTITERRALAHERMRSKYFRVLKHHDYTEDELKEFGWTLRSSIEHGMQQKKLLLQRLEWPIDPNYDRRALELTPDF